MIGIVDYGLGNIQAFADIFRRLGHAVVSVKSAEELARAEKLILPGVGAFDWAMSRLNQSGMRAELDRAVLDLRKPIIGVCVGMQMMMERSQEGGLPGLGWIAGEVLRFPPGVDGQALQLPHMGWNDVRSVAGEGLFRELSEPLFYFLHSYYVAPADAAAVIARANYAQDFAAAIRMGNIYGTQFHPEKSHDWGVRLLKNFAEL